MRFSILIAGQAGQGVKKAISIMANYFADLGYFSFVYDDYQSTIRGGHNFSLLSFSDKEIYSPYFCVNLAFFTDEECYLKHKNSLSKESVVFANFKTEELVSVFDLKNNISFDESFFSLIGVACFLYYISFTQDKIETFVKKNFKKNFEKNIALINNIYEILSEKNFLQIESFTSVGNPKKCYSGNELIAMGAVEGGLRFYASYPMTPASSVLHFLASKANEYGLCAIHAESEIAAINMAIGSAFTGKMSGTGSSGGGFALMAEGLSLAGMHESPLFVVVSSRPGPATGMSTYTAQSDLNFVIHQGHGEFPKIVASPCYFSDAFDLAKALVLLAQYYQTPTILLTEKHLSESTFALEKYAVNLDFESKVILSQESDYKRYKITENGISPLKFPPSESMIKWNSNEHQETGIRTDDADLAVKMAEKRKRKAELIKNDLLNNTELLPEKLIYEVFRNNYKTEDCTIIVTYGSTAMSVIEAVSLLEKSYKVIMVKLLEPFPLNYIQSLLQNQEYFVVEQSLTCIFAEFFSGKVYKKAKTVITQYNGRPFNPEILAKEIEEKFI